ncbi:hypothetical protein ACLUWS_03110 [Bifidobacterium boum]|uniref:hypothetical protein n=1 Tax=Bifidobacterium boum TaxID=78343 RepID=UPI003994B0EF
MADGTSSDLDDRLFRFLTPAVLTLAGVILACQAGKAAARLAGNARLLGLLSGPVAGWVQTAAALTVMVPAVAGLVRVRPRPAGRLKAVLALLCWGSGVFCQALSWPVGALAWYAGVLVIATAHLYRR